MKTCHKVAKVPNNTCHQSGKTTSICHRSGNRQNVTIVAVKRLGSISGGAGSICCFGGAVFYFFHEVYVFSEGADFYSPIYFLSYRPEKERSFVFSFIRIVGYKNCGEVLLVSFAGGMSFEFSGGAASLFLMFF